jgi:hypothetical protein
LAAVPGNHAADTSIMLDTPVAVTVLAVSTFRRRQDVLAISRERTDQSYQLVVTECGRDRTFSFSDLARLTTFQRDMEAFLVRTGWTLADFTPERRTGDDRRDLPREDNDRRRWWTDVVRGDANRKSFRVVPRDEEKNGRDGEIRTPDLLTPSQAR